MSFLVEFLHALEILDVTLVALLPPKGGLAVNRGAIYYIALSKDSRVTSGQVLRALNVSISH